MTARRAGFLLADAVLAAAILAVTIATVGGVIAAQDDAAGRAESRAAAAQCFDEAIVAIAADPGRREGSCGPLRWRLADGGDAVHWICETGRDDAVSIALPVR